jgi:cyclic pyranopterin phosphate synthase
MARQQHYASSTMPRDRYGREIDYLRISLTDRCNLRCVYCMSLSEPRFAAGGDLLDADEISRVAAAAAGVGFRKIRLTGGEPTLRSDLLEIVSRVAQTPGITDVAMTTNGILLPRLAPALKEAGLRRVNVHVDSLDRDRLSQVMRWARLDEVWAGIEAAERAGLVPIKLNCVVTRGLNDEDVVELARLTIERPWHVRFIELMPLGAGECADVARTRYVPSAETRVRIEEELGPLLALEPTHAADESRNYSVAGAAGVVGFISPVSEPYCGTCNRMRLTSDGRFHLCLLNDDELDVRTAVRRGAGAGEIGEILLRAVAGKPTGHALDVGRTTSERWMHHLGG